MYINNSKQTVQIIIIKLRKVFKRETEHYCKSNFYRRAEKTQDKKQQKRKLTGTCFKTKNVNLRGTKISFG
jgi:hypothetical protein